MARLALRLGASILALGLVTTALWPSYSVVAYCDPPGDLVASWDVTVGQILTYRFVHSWAKTPVEEYWRVESDGKLSVAGTTYRDFGAGLPGEIDGEFAFDLGQDGQPLTLTGSLLPMDAPLVRVGFGAQQELIVEGNATRLDTLAPPGSRLRFRLVQDTRLQQWLRTLRLVVR